VDLTFVPKVHNGVQMGLRGVDESLFPNNCSETPR
jgi:hypothetical protein